MRHRTFRLTALFLWALATVHAQTPNSWGMGTPMPTPRYAPFTGAIGTKIYVIGGAITNGSFNTSFLNVNEIYDIPTNTWSTGAPMPTPRYIGASAVVNNVLYTFGGGNGTQLNIVEAYDPATNTWTTKAPAPIVLNSVKAAVENNIIYLAGGFNGASGRLTTVLSYNPATNTWNSLAPLNIGKSESAVALLGSTIVSAGGLANSGAVVTDTEGYNVATNSWTTLASMPTARQASCFGVIGGQLYMAGGGISGTTASPIGILEAFNGSSWTTGLPSMPYAQATTGAAVSGGNLYCFGGVNSAGSVSNYVQIYRPSTGAPTISSGGVVSASAFGGYSSFSPGSWIEIYGSGFASNTRSWANSDFNGAAAPTSLDGTSVTIGGKAAFLDYISPGQVNAQVSSDTPTGQQQLVITGPSGTSAPYNVTVNAVQPGLLAPSSFNISGTHYAVALFPDGSYVLPAGAIPGLSSRPAKPGDVITLYGVGFGSVTPNIAAGQIVQQTNTLASPFQISIGGSPATIQYSALAPGYVGLYQFNVMVPTIPEGPGSLKFTLGVNAGGQDLYVAVGQ